MYNMSFTPPRHAVCYCSLQLSIKLPFWFRPLTLFDPLRRCARSWYSENFVAILFIMDLSTERPLDLSTSLQPVKSASTGERGGGLCTRFLMVDNLHTSAVRAAYAVLPERHRGST